MDIDKIFEDFFMKWNDSLQTKDPEKVSALYRDDCLFMPTFPEKGKEIVKKDGVSNYFSHFLLKNPFGRIVKVETQIVSNDVIKYAGLYDFEVGEEGSRTVAHAKFIFELKKENDEWKILFHGSFPILEK